MVLKSDCLVLDIKTGFYQMKRTTQQRAAIRTVLINAGGPLSPREIQALARLDAPKIGIATVYRAVKALVADGLIIQIDIPGKTPRWELARKSHHHHFLCRSCDKLFEIHGCPADLKHLLPEGYVLEKHYILLEGQCDDCATHVRRRPRKSK
jgi:Fur family ferric uptake transcriptional regulator